MSKRPFENDWSSDTTIPRKVFIIESGIASCISYDLTLQHINSHDTGHDTSIKKLAPNPKGNGLKKILHGIDYQRKMLFLTLFSGVANELDLCIGTEIQSAGKFDDMLLIQRASNDASSNDKKQMKINFFQLKHSQDENKVISYKMLLGEDVENRKKPFSLIKYFNSFRDILSHNNSEYKDYSIDNFFICSNIDVDIPEFSSSVYKEMVEEKKPFKKLGFTAYKLFVTEKDDIWKKLNDNPEGLELAYNLIDCIVNNKKLDLCKPIFKKFHSKLFQCNILVKDDTKANFHPDFLDQKVENDFYKLMEKMSSTYGKLLKDLKGFKITQNFGKSSDYDGNEITFATKDLGNDIQNFFDKLIIIKTPSEGDLDKILSQHLRAFHPVLNLIDVELALTYINEAFMDWMKEKDGSYFDKNDVQRLLENVKQKITTLEFVALNSQFCKNLQSFNVTFSENKTEAEIRSFLNDNDAKVFHLKTSEILLSAIKVYQILSSVENYKKRDSFVFDYSSQLFQQLKNIKMAFQSKTAINLLIIVCEKDKSEEFQKLLKEIIDIFPSYKKMILITDENEALPNIKNAVIEGFDDIKTDDLTPETKEYHLSKNVNFQGKLLSLNSLIKNSHSWVDSKTLLNLVTNKEINIGKKIRNFGDDHFYFPRKFHRALYFQPKDLFNANFTNDLFVIEDLSSLHSMPLPSGFRYHNLNKNDKVEKEYDHEKSNGNLHVLSENLWNWKKSYGSVSSLIKYKKIQYGNTLPYSEEDLLQKCFVEKSLIIADIAGMGKSTLLISLAMKLKVLYPEFWIIKINLTNLNKILDKNDFTSEQLLDYLFNIEHENQPFTKELFKYRLVIGKVVMVLDGYDEVNSEHNPQINNILKLIQEKNAMIWITTRKQFTEKLEELLGVFSYSFKPFKEVEQVEFLKKFWRLKFKDPLTDSKENRLHIYASAISKWILKNIDENFSGTAIVIKMCAEVFQKNDGKNKWQACLNYTEDDKVDNVPPVLPENEEIYDIYDKFTDEKVKISVNKFDSSATEASTRHELLALHRLLNEKLLKALLSSTEHKKVTVFLEDNKNEEYGLIDYIKDGQVYFTHLTFAEFFVIKFLKKKFENQSKLDIAFQCIDFLMVKASNVFKCFMLHLLKKEIGTEELRVFLDAKPLEIYAAQRKLKHLLKISMQLPCLDPDNKTALHYAAEEGHTNIVLFLLNHCFTALFDDKKPTLIYLLKYIMEKDDNEKSALDYADEKGHENIVNIFKAIKNIVNFKYSNNLKYSQDVINEILTTGEYNVIGEIKSEYYVFGYQKLLTKLFKYGDLDVIKMFYDNIDDNEITKQIFENNGSYDDAEEQTIFDKTFSKNIRDEFQKLKYLADNDGIKSDHEKFEIYDEYPSTTQLIIVAMNHERKDLAKYLLGIEKLDNYKHCFEHVSNCIEDSWMLSDFFIIYHQRFPNEMDSLFLYFFEFGIERKYIMKLFTKKQKNGQHKLKFGIDVNLESENKETPLFFAVQHREYKLKTIQFLIENHANPNAANDEKETPLLKAIYHKNFQCAKYLVKNGADVNLSNSDGITPLMLALETTGWLKNIKFLVKKGAFLFVKDNNGCTLFDYAVPNYSEFTLNDERDTFSFPLNAVDIGQYILQKGIIYNTEKLLNTTNEELKSILLFIKELFLIVETPGAIPTKKESIKLKYVINSQREQSIEDTVIIETLLHAAVSAGNLEAVKWLVENGANIKAINNLQQTPFMLAKIRKQQKISEYFQNLTADDSDSDTSDDNNAFNLDESDSTSDDNDVYD